MNSLELANKARQDKVLDKQYRFSHGVDTYRNLIDKYQFVRSEIGEVPSVEWNRIKFNRMDAKEQKEYEDKMKVTKKEYRLYWLKECGVFSIVPKMVFDYFNSKQKQ